MTPPLAPLYGLVLAGGASRRMGQDKAALALHGRPQLDWACDTLARHCKRVFVSIRADQQDDPIRSGRPMIVDVHEGAGPIAGIAAAQAAHPGNAWLVLACDLPFVDDAAISHLVGRRDGRPVVAYASSHDGLPEPLCAIYEPASREGVLAALASGRNCPRKFIVGTGVELIVQPDPTALDNVNTPEELQRARGHLGGPVNP
ncbi:MAG: NTP transferase domain-containing protein [Proteobacteria bacterium]|nr:NTP transferase domain-containing protein [Pseudomonadota bacterium]